MARIIAVHGIGQQFKGENILHREWWPALRDGLQRADSKFHLSDPNELVCPFYGYLFHKPGSLNAAPIPYKPQDVSSKEAELLQLLWEAASEAEPNQVVPPSAFANSETLARTPQIVQRALTALSRSKFFADLSQAFLIGDLKQVLGYMNDSAIHDSILKIVSDQITEDTRVVIGHSLGSIVAYEALCSKPTQVVSFVTIGSPLGIRNLIFDHLTPRPDESGIGRWPQQVSHWTNIADSGDVVALEKKLAQRFGNQVKDLIVHNGSDAHHGERYLITREAGQAIRLGL